MRPRNGENAPSRQFLTERTGRLSQLGGITHLIHAEGKAKGVSTLRVRTASGLEFWVLPDRGMDLFEASFLGRSLSWHSPTGVIHPSYYSSRSLEWLKNFAGGLLCTCGLSTAGAPSEDDNEILGLHGSISNTPAEYVTWSEDWQSDDCLFTITGKVRETSVHGPNLLLERTITTSLHSASLTLRDTVENQGMSDAPLMLLYHFNFGFPLLTERSRIYAPSVEVEAATPHSAESLNDWAVFGAPQIGTPERVYFHRMNRGNTADATIVLVSDMDKADFAISLSYDSEALPQFTQWKMMGSNHFVLGLEPGTCRSEGRAAERRRNTLQTISPGERREFHLKLSVITGVEQVASAIRAYSPAIRE